MVNVPLGAFMDDPTLDNQFLSAAVVKYRSSCPSLLYLFI